MRVIGAGVSTGMVRANRLIAATAVLMLVASAGLAQDGPRYAELPNFHKVNERLYRGGQPRAGAVKKLTELGVKTIINLRGESDQTRAEEAAAKAAGLLYFNIPMSPMSRPKGEQVLRVMAIIDAQENWPVFIHCKRGSDRTGTMVALYRISRDQWTADQALYEARRYGFSWIAFAMKDYVSDYHRDRDPGRQRSSANRYR